MTTSSAVRFGKLLKDLRKREGLSQRKVAAILRVDESVVAKLEAGTRKPPRDPAFYDRLREVPGFTESDIARLLRTEEAPRWLAAIRYEKEVNEVESQPQAVSVAGLRVELAVHAEVSELSQEEVDYIAELIQRDIELCLQDYIRHKAERAKLVSGR